MTQLVGAHYTNGDGMTVAEVGGNEAASNWCASSAQSDSGYGSRLTVPFFPAVSWCLSNASKGSRKTWCKRKALCRVVSVAVVKPEGPRGEVAQAAIYS